MRTFHLRKGAVKTFGRARLLPSRAALRIQRGSAGAFTEATAVAKRQGIGRPASPLQSRQPPRPAASSPFVKGDFDDCGIARCRAGVVVVPRLTSARLTP